jgi:hypothetical protein
MSSISCKNCQGSEFEENEDGTMSCVDCGFQREDFLTQELEDVFENTGLATRGRNYVGYVKKKKIQKGPKPKRPRKAAAEIQAGLQEFLDVYQYLMMVLLKRVLVTSGVASAKDDKAIFERYSGTLKHVWISYLKAWNRRECTMVDLKDLLSFEPAEGLKYSLHGEGFVKCTCFDEKVNHPLPPNMPLMLGFIYLTCRLEKSHIAPHSLVRWSQTGAIPYMTIWSCLPDARRVPLEHHDHPSHRYRN